MINNQMQEPQDEPIQGLDISTMESVSINDIRSGNIGKNKIPEKLQKYMAMDNIAEDLSEKQLDEIAQVVLDGYEIDKQSRVEWEAINKKAFELIAINAKEKNTPWEKAANIKYPMIIGACMQGNARLMPLLIKDDKVVKVRLMLPDDPKHILSDICYRQSAHMSYQLLGESSHWIKDTDKLTMMLFFMGIVYRKSFYNPISGQPDTELCLPDDVMVNDKIDTLENAQRITHTIYLSTNEIIENIKSGLFLDMDLEELGMSVIRGAEIDKLRDQDLKEGSSGLESKTFTTKKNEYDPRVLDVIHPFYEQHRWLDLDGDGYQEPYIATIHRDSKKTVRLAPRYKKSSFDFNAAGKFVKINAINHFTVYQLIPNPNGSFHSLGLGALLFHTNETVNSIFNQLIDAGTLANRQCGIISSSVRLPKGDFAFKPGEWKQVYNPTGADLRAGFVELPIKEPSAVLFQLLQFLIQSAKEITNVTDIMSGELPAANVPATTTMAALEQSQQVFGAILTRLHESLKSEFKKLYDLNREYLDDEIAFPMGEQLGMIKREDYMLPNYGVFPIADPKFSSQMQRIAQAQSIYQLLAEPEANRIRILLEYLNAMKVQNPQEFINIPDPEAPPSIQALTAQEQLSLMKMEKACMLMDRQLKAIELSIDEAKVKSQSADYGVKAAGQKVDAIVKLVGAHKVANEMEIARATQEEERLTRSTEIENIPQDVYQKTEQLQQLINQLLVGAQQRAGMQPIMPQQSMPPQATGGSVPPQMMPAQATSGGNELSPGE